MTGAKNLGLDVSRNGGEWLFRQGELVLGPVPVSVLIEKLYAGELDGNSTISPMGQSNFVRVDSLDLFKLHLAKAEAKLRVDAVARTEQVKRNRGRAARISAVAVVAVVVAIGAAVAARYFAVHNPWKDSDDLAFGDISVSVEPATISLAKRTVEDDLVDYPGQVPGMKRERTRAVPRPARTPAPGSAGRMSDATEDPDGLQTATIDKSAINAVVAAKQKTLYPCLVAEAQKNPGLAARIPIEFVIGNDGRVTQVWVDHPSFKTGSLPECLLRELQKWPFKAYDGERLNVGLSYNIGSRR